MKERGQHFGGEPQSPLKPSARDALRRRLRHALPVALIFPLQGNVGNRGQHNFDAFQFERLHSDRTARSLLA